jgi:hypothetical protein
MTFSLWALEDNTSWATESLLNFLAGWSYKVPREKAQLYQTQVTYMGFVLTKGRRPWETTGYSQFYPPSS